MVVPDGATLTGIGSVIQFNDGSLISSFALEKSDSNWRVVYSSNGIQPESIQLDFGKGKKLNSDSWQTTKTQLSWNAAPQQTIVEGMLSKCTLLPCETRIEEAPSTYVFYLTNFFFLGTEAVTTGNRHGKRRTLSRIKFDIDRYKVSLSWAPDYNRITRNIRTTRGIDVTAKLRVIVPDNSPAKDTFDLVENICTLLSLASGNNVTWIEVRKYGQAGRWISSELVHGVTRPYSSMSLLDLNNGSQIRSLVENGLSSLVHWDERLGNKANPNPLRSAIRLSLDAKRGGTYLQSRALAAVIIVELLSSTLAAKIGADKHLSKSQFNRMRRALEKRLLEVASDLGVDTSTTGRISRKISELNRPSFREGINSLCAEVGLSIEEGSIREFQKIRNDLVHTGDFSNEISSTQLDQFFAVLEFADQVLLAMVGFQGDYTSASNGWNKKRLNTGSPDG